MNWSKYKSVCYVVRKTKRAHSFDLYRILQNERLTTNNQLRPSTAYNPVES